MDNKHAPGDAVPRCVVLAFDGSADSCAAVQGLIDTHMQVTALIVDVGQNDDLDELRSRALARGAARADVVDRCEVFAREAIMPAVAAGVPIEEAALSELAQRVVAAAVVEVAAIEGGDSWLPPFGGRRPEHHLLMRRPGRPATDDARLTIEFDRGIPVSVNGVTMGLRELIEIVSLIGGQYPDQRWSGGSPALGILQAAYRACNGHGSTTLHLEPQSVTHA
jgi:argininosuccinate synthase